jgi:hypothetical protein
MKKTRAWLESIVEEVSHQDRESRNETLAIISQQLLALAREFLELSRTASAAMRSLDEDSK